MTGDDVVGVVVGQQHALDLAAGQPGPEHRRRADAPEPQRSPVHGGRQVEVRVQPGAAAVERVAHPDDRLLERVDVGHRTRVDPYAEKRQIDHAQGRHAVLEQAEHYPAQRRAGRVVDRAVERIGDPDLARIQGSPAALFAVEADIGCRCRQRALHRRLAGQVDLGEEVLGRLGDPLVRPGASVAQDRHRVIHRGVRRSQFGSHPDIVVSNLSNH